MSATKPKPAIRKMVFAGIPLDRILVRARMASQEMGRFALVRFLRDYLAFVEHLSKFIPTSFRRI